MRVSNHGVGRRSVATLMIAFTLTACAASAPPPTPLPTVAPTPVVTPDPHLTDPASADAVVRAIGATGLPLSITNAIAGDASSPIVKRINAAVDNWPLVVTQYKNSAALRAAIKWDPTKAPAAGSPPYLFVGLNILISFGPTSGKPVAPDAARQAEAQRLVGALDPLLWPLEQRSTTPILTRTAPPPSAAPPSGPKATPKPSHKATPKPSPKR
jgi:hypothetical protein